MANIEIGGRLHSTATGNTVAGANEVLDDTQNKKQNVINAELIEAVGQGGSVDTRIANAINALDSTKSQSASADGLALSITETDGKIASISGSIAPNTYDAAGAASTAKTEVIGDAASDYNTLGKIEDKLSPIETAIEDCAYLEEGDSSSTIADFDPQADSLWKKQQTLSAAEKVQVQQNIGVREWLNNLTGEKFASVTATDQTTSVTSLLPATGATDTVYRVGKWDGTQYNEEYYSDYAWDGTAYVQLNKKSIVGEVFDISEYHAGQTYADLAAALGVDGANVPQSVRKGGMSVKYIDAADNKYVQFRYMGTEVTSSPNPFLNIGNWDKISFPDEVQLALGEFGLAKSISKTIATAQQSSVHYAFKKGYEYTIEKLTGTTSSFGSMYLSLDGTENTSEDNRVQTLPSFTNNKIVFIAESDALGLNGWWTAGVVNLKIYGGKISEIEKKTTAFLYITNGVAPSFTLMDSTHLKITMPTEKLVLYSNAGKIAELDLTSTELASREFTLQNAQKLVYDYTNNTLSVVYNEISGDFAVLLSVCGTIGTTASIDGLLRGFYLRWLNNQDLNKYVRFDAATSLTTEQKNQAKSNIGIIVDEEPVSGSNNFVKSGGVSKYLMNKYLLGKGNTLSNTIFYGMIPGKSYRVCIDKSKWLYNEITPIETDEGFSIYSFNSSNASTNLVKVLAVNLSTLKDTYDITIPQDSVLVRFYGRINDGVEVPVSVTLNDADTEPTAGSKNPVQSNGVAEQLYFNAFIKDKFILHYTHSGSGTYHPQDSRNAIIHPLHFDKDVIISIQSGYKYAIQYYDGEETGSSHLISATEWYTDTQTVLANSYWCMIVANVRDAATTDAETNALSFSGGVNSGELIIQEFKDVKAEIETIDDSGINEPKPYSYSGEPIAINSFGANLYKNLSNSWAQSMAIYDDYVIFFSNSTNKAQLYSIVNKTLLATFDIPNGGYFQPHCNTAMCGVEFAEQDSIMPVIYLSQWDAGHERACFVYDVSLVNGVYSLTLVQKINFASISSSLIGSGECDFVVDKPSSKIYAIAYKSSNTAAGQGVSTLLCGFNLPLLNTGDTITMTDADVLLNFETDLIKYRQDAFMNGDRIFIAYGGLSSVKCGIAVIDIKTQSIITDIPIYKYVDGEPECMDLYKNKMLLFNYGTNLHQLVY